MRLAVPAASLILFALAVPAVAASAPNALPPATDAKAKPAGPAAATQGPTSPGVVDATGEWRGAHWGMSADEVLRHFTGEAKPVDPELKLANGATVSVRVDGQTLLGNPLRAAFVFEGGKLALVSLRTPERHYAAPEVYAAAAELITAKLGKPKDAASDTNFIDLRQTSWVLPKGQLDLKYIPGVIVLLYHPLDLKPVEPAPR
jgi:hypothetical protein